METRSEFYSFINVRHTKKHIILNKLMIFEDYEKCMFLGNGLIFDCHFFALEIICYELHPLYQIY